MNDKKGNPHRWFSRSKETTPPSEAAEGGGKGDSSHQTSTDGGGVIEKSPSESKSSVKKSGKSAGKTQGKVPEGLGDAGKETMPEAKPSLEKSGKSAGKTQGKVPEGLGDAGKEMVAEAKPNLEKSGKSAGKTQGKVPEGLGDAGKEMVAEAKPNLEKSGKSAGKTQGSAASDAKHSVKEDAEVSIDKARDKVADEMRSSPKEATTEANTAVKKLGDIGKRGKMPTLDPSRGSAQTGKSLTGSIKSFINLLPGKGVTAGIIGVATLAAGATFVINSIQNPKGSTPPGNPSAVEAIPNGAPETAGGDASGEAGSISGAGSDSKETGEDPSGDGSETSFTEGTIGSWVFTFNGTSNHPDCGDGSPAPDWRRDVSYSGSSFTSDPEEQPYVKGELDSSGQIDMEIIIENEKSVDGCGDYSHLIGVLQGNTIEGTYDGHDCESYCIWSGTFRVTIDG